MVGSSKILTVGYGTFSCTLEGFDESFDTMKAIAEYFRDLAADDRYFGAEPPTPDAEMLARIAEKEIARRVEAHMESSGIVLRPAAAIAAERGLETPETQVEPAPQAKAEQSQPAEPELAETPEPEVVAETAPADPVMPPPVAEPVAPAPAAPTDSVAAKLQRIRAVVGKTDEEPTADFIEDAHANDVSDDFDLGAVLDAADIIDDEPVTAEIELPTEPKQAVAEAEADEIDVSSVLDQSDEAVEPSEPETPAEPKVEAAEETAPRPAPRTIRVIRAKRSQIADAVKQGHIEEIEEPKPEAKAEEPEQVQDKVEDVADLDGLDEFDAVESTLSDEEEAELLADLADLDEDSDEIETEDTNENAFSLDDDFDLEDILDDDEPVVEQTPTERAEKPGRDVLNGLSHDQDVSRLMDRTDEHLSAPETNQRRNNLSHLKAAVAATEAARRMGDDEQEKAEEEKTRFRDDLSKVVRDDAPKGEPVQPRRAAPTGRTERPRPAPLKLVASQRIDVAPTKPAEPAAPVRPRRIASAELAATPAAQNAQSFADFAEGMGAHSLPELLEAAAAYTSFVEGLEDFSRPQVMKKVREIYEDDFNREDGLRVFGTLLREGRISKVRNGRFQVSNQTRFRPELRRA
ncbi:hypothetical protein BVC71_11460 [Marivivens niveibacter]|uniref:Chemotaxis protein CheA n=1 Tax=Marivivens niveibacter TaxID=1930667 RepID=A0A251WYU1_9RHOB|nr:hypothetical protein [Marivivens niveibacter]OUD09305.1 hypothetical protein BVC71_11460 [Marivivens niveibacter]